VSGERKTYGTRGLETPITREDFERAVRYLHLSDLDQRDLLLRLAAQVVALTEATGAQIDEAVPDALARIREADARSTGRVWIDTDIESKYEIAGSTPPCDELMHLCQARCCKMIFALSTNDLDEGVIRWDYGQPYMIRQRASDGYCVHNDPASHGCTVHAQRPATCRRYDCSKDTRVWLDYEKRIPAPMDHPGDGTTESFDLMERVKLKALAEVLELNAISRTYPEDHAAVGPAPNPRAPRKSR
jgi:Fe-S-cluster containining protein